MSTLADTALRLFVQVHARLWRIVNANNADRYDGYQARTSRPIPVVRLTP
jgi:hypothetical protein